MPSIINGINLSKHWELSINLETHAEAERELEMLFGWKKLLAGGQEHLPHKNLSTDRIRKKPSARFDKWTETIAKLLAKSIANKQFTCFNWRLWLASVKSSKHC